MQVRQFGNTGIYVSPLVLGTMTFGGGPFWERIGRLEVDEATTLLRRAFDAGVNLFDTADVYAASRSEQILGEALRKAGIPRDEVLVATKVHERTSGHPNGAGSSRGRILAGADASLARLRVDHIDLLQLHGVDAVTPIEETLEALDRLVASGKVRYVGACNFPGWRVEAALAASQRRGLAQLVSNQVHYALASRDAEREVLPQAAHRGLATMAWSPLAGGLLSGKFDPHDPARGPEGARRTGFDFPPVDRARAAAAVAAAREIADGIGATVAQVALAWLLRRADLTCVIVGVRDPRQLEENLGAVEVARQLSDGDLTRLDAASALPPEYPGWMLAYQDAARRPGGRRPATD